MSGPRRFDGWRRAYSRVVRLYPRRYRERFAEGMEQTFVALLRERTARGRSPAGAAIALLADAALGVVRSHALALLMHRRILRVALATSILLLIPFAAMRFTDEVRWTALDFIVAGALISGTGLAYVFLTERSVSLFYRAGAALALGTGLAMTWVNLAVGIIGAETDPANRLYTAVVVVGIVGACVARFRAAGMARALLVTAIAQALVPIVALALGHPSPDVPGATRAIVTMFALSECLAALFCGSAWLFRRAVPPGSSAGRG